MSKNELERIWGLPSNLPYKERIDELHKLFIENSLEQKIDVEVESRDNGEKVLYPSRTRYNHYFSDGLYVREMFCAGGYFGFTAIHNLANPLFVMEGIMWCTAEDGVQKLVAPTFVLTEPGTKRMCYFSEDSVVVTVHPNPDGLTSLDEIEKKYFSATWEQYGDDIGEKVWKLVEHEEYYKTKNMNKKNKTL